MTAIVRIGQYVLAGIGVGEIMDFWNGSGSVNMGASSIRTISIFAAASVFLPIFIFIYTKLKK